MKMCPLSQDKKCQLGNLLSDYTQVTEIIQATVA